ncbi:head-tail connector protein [Streptomyces sp. NRRL B-1381]|uniref:head-tail connector protein n=1 Tax=Streptomyces sp. NRRL B-1381 TaxID=1463829 RepID=UPI00067C524B|nr:head-tail connector protein [Streptomyces sp. NRRL B-1381]
MALLTLDEAKAQLDYDSDANDAEIQAYIDALTPVIELHTGPVENRTVTETVNGRGPLLALTQVPVVSLTSLTPRLSSGLAVDVSEMVLDPDAGVVRRLDGASWSGGPWTAVYVAGRGEVPPTINLAARMLLQHLWRTQYGAARGGGGADDYSVTEPVIGYGYAIPNRVLHLLEPFKAPPGFA